MRIMYMELFTSLVSEYNTLHGEMRPLREPSYSHTMLYSTSFSPSSIRCYCRCHNSRQSLRDQDLIRTNWCTLLICTSGYVDLSGSMMMGTGCWSKLPSMPVCCLHTHQCTQRLHLEVSNQAVGLITYSISSFVLVAASAEQRHAD